MRELEIHGERGVNMFFLLTHSNECLKSNLDLFSLLSTQTSSQWIYYTRNIAPIEFVIPSHGENYLDLMHIMLNLRIRVETLPIPGAASTTPANVVKVDSVIYYIPCSIKSTYILIKSSYHLQTTLTYIKHTGVEVLLSYASPTKISHLTSCLWDANIPDFMDEKC